MKKAASKKSSYNEKGMDMKMSAMKKTAKKMSAMKKTAKKK